MNLSQRAGFGGMLALLALGLAGCQSETIATPTPPPVVRVAPIAAGTLAQPHLIGTVVPGTQSAAGFLVGGRIAERLVERGAQVQAGQVLAKLDLADLQAKVAASSAQLQQASAAAQFAEQNFGRIQAMMAKKLTSQQEFDQAKSNINAARAAQTAARAQLDSAQLALNYGQLKAPFAGVVVSIDADRGAVVAAGQPVVTLAQAGGRQVLVAVPENRLAGLPHTAQAQIFGQPARLDVTFASVEGAVDAASRTWQVRFNLPANTPTELGLGQTVTLIFADQTVPKTVPIGAIIGAGDQAGVFVVREGKAVFTPVQVQNLGQESAVIFTHLPVGTPVVALGVNRLHDGEPVRIQPGLGS
ncbi:MAG: efflux RND transporter periplasmic adaptor subunit [Halothiobacillus sp.]